MRDRGWKEERVVLIIKWYRDELNLLIKTRENSAEDKIVKMGKWYRV